MASILCLAHYCDTHGPTPMMVTEGLPVGCTSCFEDENFSERRPSTSAPSLNPAGGLAGISRAAMRTNSVSSDKEITAYATPNEVSSSAIETPPESPRVTALQGNQHAKRERLDSSFRKTYDENDKKRAIPCENCALTLPPQNMKEGVPTSTIDYDSPILRTRKPYERIAVPTIQPSPPDSSSSSESDNALSRKSTHRRTRSKTLNRTGTSSSNSSFNSNGSTSHDHFLDFTSSHEPLGSSSFSMVRQSCLRTLSCETLPPSSTQSNSTPTSPFINNPFSSGPSSGTTSGGPIFFGDPLAGYTTAYLFRIPDPNARGRRRVYALMALSTHRQQAAVQHFSFLSTAFRELAAWIQNLAEAELERVGNANSPRINEDKGSASNHSTPTSSFLSGRNRGQDGRFAGMSIKSRGLADVVGLPDFFIQLHRRFVMLLLEMNLQLRV